MQLFESINDKLALVAKLIEGIRKLVVLGNWIVKGSLHLGVMVLQARGRAREIFGEGANADWVGQLTHLCERAIWFLHL